MKAELIADWRLRIKDRTLITLPVSAIERILEERDKLLEALRNLYLAEDEQSKLDAGKDAVDAINFADADGP